MNTKFIGTKQLRQNMAEITKDAQKKNERIIVLRKNQPIFELKPLSNEESFKESFIRDIEKARADVKAGRVYSFEKICKEFGL